MGRGKGTPNSVVTEGCMPTRNNMEGSSVRLNSALAYAIHSSRVLCESLRWNCTIGALLPSNILTLSIFSLDSELEISEFKIFMCLLRVLSCFSFVLLLQMLIEVLKLCCTGYLHFISSNPKFQLSTENLPHLGCSLILQSLVVGTILHGIST